MSEITTCPDCAKALEKWHRLERRMARRGNFGIVPLPSTCPKHKAGAPIGQHSRIAELERKLALARKGLLWIQVRARCDAGEPLADKISAVAADHLAETE